MANFKTHFAAHMPVTIAQAQKALELFEELENAHAEGRHPGGDEGESFDDLGRMIEGLPELGFQIAAHPITADGQNLDLLLTPGEGVGNEQIAAAFIQELLREFEDDDRIVGMQWSQTSNSPRADGFMGGYFVITADEIQGADTNALMAAEIEKMEASRTAAPALG
jgi:hypothetical protein